MKHARHGFSLIELMIVVAIIAFLAMIAVPNFSRFLAKAKRAEAYMNLSSIYIAQKAYWAEHGTYTTNLSGSDGVGWVPEGYKSGGSGERFYYTYGFSNGQEGTHFFTGKLNASSNELAETYADQNGFLAAAAGDIDGDGVCDVITVNHLNEIKILKNDIA